MENCNENTLSSYTFEELNQFLDLDMVNQLIIDNPTIEKFSKRQYNIPYSVVKLIDKDTDEERYAVLGKAYAGTEKLDKTVANWDQYGKSRNKKDEQLAIDRLGAGGYGLVKKYCLLKKEGEKWVPDEIRAIKITEMYNCSVEKCFDEMDKIKQFQEGSSMGFFHRKNVGFKESGKFYTDMILFKHKSLDDYDQEELAHLTNEDKIKVAEDLFSELDKMHKKGVYHNDIKQQNILFDIENLKVHIIDFGEAEDESSPKQQGIDRYYALLVLQDLFFPKKNFDDDSGENGLNENKVADALRNFVNQLFPGFLSQNATKNLIENLRVMAQEEQELALARI